MSGGTMRGFFLLRSLKDGCLVTERILVTLAFLFSLRAFV